MLDIKNRAVVSARGTITIPEPIRAAAHIRPGDIIEFKPERNRIILSHLIVEQPEAKAFMSNSEWKKFDKLLQTQIKKAQFRSCTDLEEAKQHSRKLMHKKRNNDYKLSKEL